MAQHEDPNTNATSSTTEEGRQVENNVRSPMKKVKRMADRQLTKDDYDEESAEQKEQEQGAGSFARADEATLKARKILKVSKQFVTKIQRVTQKVGGNDGVVSSTQEKVQQDSSSDVLKKEETKDDSKSNPFSAFSFDKEASFATAPIAASGLSFTSSADTNPFASIASSSGGGFGFGNASKSNTKEASKTGFRSISASSNNIGAKIGSSTLSFTSSANTNPFAAVAASTGNSSSGFGTIAASKASSDLAQKSSPSMGINAERPEADKEKDEALTLLSAESNMANGEEEEECVMECRAKLFRLTQKVDKGQSSLKMTPKNESGGSVAASQSGPMNLSALSKKDDNTQAKDENSKASDDTKEKKQIKEGSGTEWREVGIGPVRLLRTKNKDSQTSTRVVMRREKAPGGPGTKVILNVKLISLSNVSRSGDKFVRMTIVTEDSLPVNYLFKVKTVNEVEKLIKEMENAISEASS